MCVWMWGLGVCMSLSMHVQPQFHTYVHAQAADQKDVLLYRAHTAMGNFKAVNKISKGDSTALQGVQVGVISARGIDCCKMADAMDH